MFIITDHRHYDDVHHHDHHHYDDVHHQDYRHYDDYHHDHLLMTIKIYKTLFTYFLA
jgi:hypothetical protein